ncbi:MAG: crossover junction endodeoxyribonuclease RuvC [Candidatus Komeilibacteria bacterium]
MATPATLILGIDPGFADTGWGVISFAGQGQMLACGSISTPKSDSFSDRLLALGQQLTTIIKTYRPDMVAIEELFFNTNVTTGIKVAMARGVIMYVCRQAGLPVREFTPGQIKLALTSDGRASKAQMGKMIQLLLNLSVLPQPDDAVDALACALTCAHTKLYV